MSWARTLLSRLGLSTDPAASIPRNPPVTLTGDGFAVIDVETTGFSPVRDRVLEIGVVLCDPTGRAQHEWTARINPEGPVGATHVHGITQQDVAAAPYFRDVVPHLTSLIAGRALVAHNAKFDFAFLGSEYGRANWAWPEAPSLCTLENSWYYLPHLDRRRLPDCCWATGITLQDAHSALGDARATATLLQSFLDPGYGRPPLPDHRSLPTLARQVRWPTGPGVETPDARLVVPQPSQAKAPRSAPAYRPTRAVTRLLDSFTLTDSLDEGVPRTALPYLELLVEALEDGELSPSELAGLNDAAEAAGLGSEVRRLAHLGFLRALARAATEDGVVTRTEKAQLLDIAGLLDLPKRELDDLIGNEHERRLQELSANLAPLPADWTLGDPLRVGQRVVFTGCRPDQRASLESAAEKAGVRVTGSVSGRTAILVTDGSFTGTKVAASQRLGTRQVHPDKFAILLKHIQPHVTPGA